MSPATTAHDVASRAVWTTETLDTFSRRMRRPAIGETLAHLEHAVQDGPLHRTREDGVVLYENA